VIRITYRRRRYRFADYRVTFDDRIRATACVGLRRPASAAASVPFAILETKTSAPYPHLPAAGAREAAYGDLGDQIVSDPQPNELAPEALRALKSERGCRLLHQLLRRCPRGRGRGPQPFAAAVSRRKMSGLGVLAMRVGRAPLGRSSPTRN